MYHIGCNRSCYDDSVDASTETTRHITFEFKSEELLYDIKNYAYIEGHVMGEENQEAQHMLVDIGEEGNIDRVARILAVVHAAAIEMLYPYTKAEPSDQEVISDVAWRPRTYVIEMDVPATISRTTLVFLNRLIHEYMVYRVLHDWLGITFPAAADKWLLKAQEAEEEINDIKNTRTGILRRPAHPF